MVGKTLTAIIINPRQHDTLVQGKFSSPWAISLAQKNSSSRPLRLSVTPTVDCFKAGLDPGQGNGDCGSGRSGGRLPNCCLSKQLAVLFSVLTSLEIIVVVFNSQVVKYVVKGIAFC